MFDAFKPGWYRPTPGRLLLVLLVVEGLLWITDWLHWLPMGYAVLIAVAGVGVFLLLMLLWYVLALVFRVRFQFSIRSLLVLVVAVAVPSNWLGAQMERARRQREAVAGLAAIARHARQHRVRLPTRCG